MSRANNDATLTKLGDIFQYYIALLDCFKMEKGDKLQIEVSGDVSIISGNYGKSFQREVKHHLGDFPLGDRHIDLWKTLYNWYAEYERVSKFDFLNLYTTSQIKEGSRLFGWNLKSKEDKLLVLKSIGETKKKKEKTFRNYYMKIFDKKNYNEKKILDLLSKFEITHGCGDISQLSESFDEYVRHIPEENRNLYISTLLGEIVTIATGTNFRWEISSEQFDRLLQKNTASHSSQLGRPLPLGYANRKISNEEEGVLQSKRFVEAIKEINYESVISDAISDYWKTQGTVIHYLRDDLLYLEGIPNYQRELKNRLVYLKKDKQLEIESLTSIKKTYLSKKMYIEAMRWEAKDFDSIIRNQDYFQRGMIHSIIDENKFNWKLEEK